MSPVIEEAVTDPLLVVTGPEGRLKDQFVGIVTLIGRSADADICLPSPEVDELHCLLTQTTAGLVAKDCFTTAGLIVNGERVTETLLGHSDEIEIGPYKLIVKLPTLSANALNVGEAQQDLIQQMAKRIAKLEGKRDAALRRAWRFRTRGGRPPGEADSKVARRGSTPFGNIDASRLKAMEAELTAERRRTATLESELHKVRDLAAHQVGLGDGSMSESVAEVELRAEIERLNDEIARRKSLPEDHEAMESLKEYEQQLNEFRDQLSHDAEEIQLREQEVAQRFEEIRIAEEQLQVKIADTEKELAGERARVKREQAQLERMIAECRQDLEEMQREAENIERDEKYQRLRSQIRGHRDEKDSSEPPTVSERISRFLKGLGG
jgi:pSer/pThr/pTyr-binding forkhead associated (FHA) protein